MLLIFIQILYLNLLFCTYSCCTFCIKLSVLPFGGTLHIGYLFGVEGGLAPKVLHNISFVVISTLICRQVLINL